MKKLTALILSAAIAPAFVLSTAAIAAKHGEIQADDKKPVDEQNAGEQHANDQKTGMQNADMQRSGESQLSGKPDGALYATDVIGNNVMHRGTDEDVGEIEDLIIGKDGRIIGVVVKTSGFLGLGGQEAGLGWNHIEHSMEGDESVFYTDIEEEALRNSPKYERD